MKHSFVHRTAGGLIVAFVIVIGVLLAGVGSARAAKNAMVEVGFVGVPPPNFQNVLLNVQSVRINPDVSAAPGNGKWQTIPVPPGIGNAGRNADLQIDLNASQNTPQIFNTAGVQAGTYRIVELRLDSNNPGTLVPDCPNAPGTIANPSNTADGCISYPIQLAGNNVITFSNADGLIFPANKIMTPLILQVSMSAPVPPTVPGGAYTVTITLTTPPTNAAETGIVTGSVNVNGSKGSGSSASGKIRKLTVTAEAIGTNTAIASTPVKNGQYTLILPAAATFGTLYDLAVAGGADTYAAQRLLPLYQGQQINAEFTGSNSLTGGQTLGNITGTISDNCVATKPIVGATLQLLIPPDPPNPNSSVDCSVPGNAPLCVAVATANTDNTGYFPLPGTISIPAEFENVPVVPKKTPYVMEVTAPGYDPLFVYAVPTSNSKGGTCAPIGSTTPTFGACDFALNTGYITGAIPIEPPVPGQTTLVQVFAEDAGTNNIESALPMPITVTSSNGGTIGYTLNVPPSVSTFDLFATTIDTYQGVTDPYPGHTIVVKSGVTGPAEPSKPGACSTATPTPFDQSIECIGHGSVTGIVGNANLGTSVVLSKQDTVSLDFVAITNTLVQNQLPNLTPSNNYSFCAPADTYQVQEWQLPTPEADATPSSSPTASPVPDTAAIVMIPLPPSAGGPSPTPTPAIRCPTTCENPDGTCPGICSNVIQPLPPTPSPAPTP
ncbi:MAG: hypothetical protein ABSB13_10415 [Candidatus Binatus sp.]|uniref:DUF4382 domain-containing protein n=1 Tax=Candidatus Binatus sp. TaxID=2811406 RepID=UPI003D098BBB